MTPIKDLAERVERSPNATAADLVLRWNADPYAVHKRPPFRAHSFDDDERFWVVGTTSVSVLHGWHGDRETAERWATLLNEAATLQPQEPTDG